MRRLKITAIAVIFVLSLIVAIISAGKPVASAQSINDVSSVQPLKSFVDQRALQNYNRQKEELKAALQDYFDEAIASGEIVGAGVSIVKGDSIVVSNGFGKRNNRSDAAIDGQTIFRLGSLSKGFTGILAANLKSEGKLNWDDRVSDFIPGFRLGDRSNTNQITIANILSHTSGAPYHSFTNLVEAGLPLTDIARRFSTVKPISKPGSLYSYQNALFALAGEMMYKSTGQEINTLLENRFFKPLQMCSTTMDHKTLLGSENVAMPHSRYRSGWRPAKLTDHYYNAIAAGGINASALDMARWMRLLLGYHPEIMDKSSIEEAFNPLIEITGRSKYYQRWPGHLSSHYGFGWRIHKFKEDGNEKTIWHHGGSVNDFRNEIAVYPEADLGICVLLNNNSRLARHVIPDLYNIIQKVYANPTANIASNSETNPIPDF